MNTRGYDGLYKQRTQHTNKKQDGCAIFYKRKKLKVLEVKTIEFNDLADLRCRSGAAATAAASALMDQESPQVAAEVEPCTSARIKTFRTLNPNAQELQDVVYLTSRVVLALHTERT